MSDRFEISSHQSLCLETQTFGLVEIQVAEILNISGQGDRDHARAAVFENPEVASIYVLMNRVLATYFLKPNLIFPAVVLINNSVISM